MSDLIVVGFDSTDEADKVLLKLNSLRKEYLIDLEDAVVVVRDADGKVHLKQSMNLTTVGATSGLLSGSLWAGSSGCSSLIRSRVSPSAALSAPVRVRFPDRSSITASTTTSSSRSATPSRTIPRRSSSWCARCSRKRCWPNSPACAAAC